eukprot:ANDGO_02719.mRNA.1 hypothetical protein
MWGVLVRRVSQLVRHLHPPEPDSRKFYAGRCIVPQRYTVYGVFLSSVGNTHGLSIAALSNAEAVARFKNSAALRTALLSSNHDACDFPIFFTEFLRQLDENALLKYHVIGNATMEEARHGTAWLQGQTMRDPSGVVLLYYSGHGRLSDTMNLELRFSDVSDSAICFNELFDTESTATSSLSPPLVILDCCHSGAAVEDCRRRGMMCMCSTSADARSGGWVLDGVDSNGILTKFLMDPVGSYIKVRWNVFHDFSGSMFDPSSSVGVLYGLIVQHVTGVLDRELDRRTRGDLFSLPAALLRLWIHFALFCRLSNSLYMVQYPVSSPSVAACFSTAVDSLWLQFEADFETCMLSLLSSPVAE